MPLYLLIRAREEMEERRNNPTDERPAAANGASMDGSGTGNSTGNSTSNSTGRSTPVQPQRNNSYSASTSLTSQPGVSTTGNGTSRSMQQNVAKDAASARRERLAELYAKHGKRSTGTDDNRYNSRDDGDGSQDGRDRDRSR